MSLPRTTIAAVTLLALAPGALRAQVISLPQAGSNRPAIWVSGGGALFNLGGFAGGDDGAYWGFGDGIQLRGTVERALRRDLAVGLAGSFARLPLSVSGGGCGSCDGDATVWQGLATLRMGGGGSLGFHSAFELSAGATGFANFSGAGTGAPTSAARSIVPSVAASYGAGYTLYPGLEIALVQEIGVLFYEPVAGAADDDSTPRFTATRLVLRYALPRR